MNSLIKIILLVSVLFPSTSSSKIGGAMSVGFMSEKIPLTLLDFTGYYSPNQKTEFFATFSYLVFGGGLGLGAKYYFIDKNKISPFASVGFSASVAGDTIESYVGPHIAVGYSISFRKIIEEFGIDEIFNIVINTGYGYAFYNDCDNCGYPFLNGEVKFEFGADYFGI